MRLQGQILLRIRRHCTSGARESFCRTAVRMRAWLWVARMYIAICYLGDTYAAKFAMWTSAQATAPGHATRYARDVPDKLSVAGMRQFCSNLAYVSVVLCESYGTCDIHRLRGTTTS